MQTPLSPANREAMAAHLAVLDTLINKLTRCGNSTLKNSSLMFSGMDSDRQDIHELIAWGKYNPPPVVLLKQFLKLYLNELMLQRNNLAQLIESNETAFAERLERMYCRYCCRETTHRNYYFIPGSVLPAAPGTLICSQCETIFVEQNQQQ